MKKFTALFLAAAGILFAGAAQAQYSIQTTTLNGGTNNVAASTTNSVTAPVLAFTRSTYGVVQTTFKLTGAGSSTVVLTFDESVDNSNWDLATRTLSVTANGTTAVTGLSNYTLGGAGYLRLSSVENPNAAAITNLVVKYSYKPGL